MCSLSFGNLQFNVESTTGLIEPIYSSLQLAVFGENGNLLCANARDRTSMKPVLLYNGNDEAKMKELMDKAEECHIPALILPRKPKARNESIPTFVIKGSGIQDLIQCIGKEDTISIEPFHMKLKDPPKLYDKKAPIRTKHAPKKDTLISRTVKGFINFAGKAMYTYEVKDPLRDALSKWTGKNLGQYQHLCSLFRRTRQTNKPHLEQTECMKQIQRHIEDRGRNVGCLLIPAIFFLLENLLEQCDASFRELKSQLIEEFQLW